MIVIAIIGLLIGVGSLAWGAMIRSGNETAAITMMERLRTFQAQYASQNRGRFGTFDQLIQASGLDEKFAGENPTVNGYKFTMVLVEPSSSAPAKFEIWADPQVPTGVTATGNRYFYSSSSVGTTKANSETRAGEQDPSV